MAPPWARAWLVRPRSGGAPAGFLVAWHVADELHVLGIGVDPIDDAFEAAIAAQRGARRLRFTATVVRLRDIGVPVDAHLPEGVMESDDALGRPTLARALVAAGHAESVEDAFRRILGHGLPGYVPRTGMGPVEAIRAIRAAGGLASIAHFGEAPQRVPLLRELAEGALDFIRCCAPRHAEHFVIIALGCHE